MPRSRSPSAGRPSRRSRSLASFDSLGAPLALPVPSGARRHPLAPSTSSAAALAAGFSSPLPAVPYFISRLCSSLAAFAAARLLADPVAAPPVAVATALAASAAATAAAAFRRSVPVRPSAAALAAGAPVAAQLAAWVGAVAVLGALRALLLAAVAAAPVAAALRPRGGSSSPSSTAALGVGGGGVTASVARGRRTVVAVAVLVGLAALLTADMDAGSAAGGRRTATFGTARGGALSAAAGRRLAHSRAAARLGRISLAAVERVAAANGAGEKGGGVAGRVRHSVVAPRWARHAAVRLRERLAPDGVAVEGAEASAGGASSGPRPGGDGTISPPLPVPNRVDPGAPAGAQAADGGKGSRVDEAAADTMGPPDRPPLAGIPKEPPRAGSDVQGRRRLLWAAGDSVPEDRNRRGGRSRSRSRMRPQLRSESRREAAAAAAMPGGEGGDSGSSGESGDVVAGAADGQAHSDGGAAAADDIVVAPPVDTGDGGVVAALPLDDAALSVDGAALGADSAAPGVAGAGLLGNAAPLAGEAADLGDDNRAVPADNPLPPTVDSVRDAGGSWAWRHALRALTGAALVGFSCTWAASPAFVALAVELHSRRAARVAALYSAALLLALPAAATGLRSGLSPLPPLSAAPLVLVAAVGGIVVPAAMEHRAADRAAEPVPGFPSASGRHRSVSRHRGASAVGGGGKSSAAGHWAAMGAAGGGAIFGAFAGCSEGPAVGVVLFAVAATVAHFLVPGAEPGGAGGVSVAAVLAVALGALAAPFCVPAGGSGTDGGGVADAAGASGSRAGGNRSGLPRALRQVASVRRKLRSAANFVSAARRQHAMWQALTFLGFQAALVVGEWTYAAVSESPGLLSASADTLLCCIGLAVSLHALRLRANGDVHLGDARVGGSGAGRGGDGGAHGGIKGKSFASSDSDRPLDATDVPSSPTTPGGGSLSVALASAVQEQSRLAPLAAFVNAILLLFGAVVAVAGAISRVVGPTGAVAGEGRIVAVSLLSAAGNGLGLFFMASTKPKTGNSGGSGGGRGGSRGSEGAGGRNHDTSRLRASVSTASVVAAVTSTTAAALSAASGACGNDAVRSIAAQVWANTVTCGAAVVGCGLRWAAGLRGGEVAATAVAALAITAAAGSLGVDAARRLCLGIPAGDAEAIDAATATIAASPAVGRVERAVAWPLPGGGVAAVARLRVVVGANESAVTADAVAAYVAAGVRREWVTIEVVGGA